VEINGRPTIALVDTGASASFILEELVEVLGIATQRKKHGYQLTAIDGGDLPIVDRETAPTTLKIN
jgi:predicted aspartyl protease